MEDISIAVILGIVEGLTEFLPVSSTGHLIVCGHLLGFNDEFGKTFDIAIQLGAIFSVVVHFREKIIFTVKQAFVDAAARNFLAAVLLAFLPAAVAGLFLHKWIKAYLFNPFTVGAALILGGVAILIIERKAHPEGRESPVESITFRQALLIGCAQCFSLFPGVSRSAATILGGVIFGLSRTAAVEFSFFLAIPTMFAATGYSLLKDSGAMNGEEFKILAVGFIVSLLVALAVIRWFLKFVQTHTFVPFAWYRMGFGLLVLWIF